MRRVVPARARLSSNASGDLETPGLSGVLLTGGPPVSSTPDKPGVSRSPLALLLSLALAGTTLLIYCPVLDSAFVNFDDPSYVVQNRHVQAGLTAAGIRWALTSFEQSNWHPLT